MKSVNTQAANPTPASRAQRKPRVGGFLKGQTWAASDCWEKDEDVITMMTEGPIFPDEPLSPAYQAAQASFSKRASSPQ